MVNNDCKFFIDEGVYVDTYGKISKNVVLQWGELPTSVGAYCLNKLKKMIHFVFQFVFRCDKNVLAKHS